MHELGIMIGVVEKVERIAKANQVTKIDTLVLQVGELSSMVPMYIENCFPMVIEGTMLEHTKLQIEVLPGNGRCLSCGHTYNLLKQNHLCPECGSGGW